MVLAETIPVTQTPFKSPLVLYLSVNLPLAEISHMARPEAKANYLIKEVMMLIVGKDEE